MMDEKQASLVLSVDPASYEYATRFRHTRCNELRGRAWQSRWAHLASMQNNVNKILNYAQQKVYLYIYIHIHIYSVYIYMCVCTNWTVFIFTHYIHTSYLWISRNHHKYSAKITLNIFVTENQFFTCDTGKECLHNIYINFSHSIFFTKNRWKNFTNQQRWKKKSGLIQISVLKLVMLHCAVSD